MIQTEIRTERMHNKHPADQKNTPGVEGVNSRFHGLSGFFNRVN